MASTVLTILLVPHLFLDVFCGGAEGRWVLETSKLHANSFQNWSSSHVDASEKLDILFSKENTYQRRFLSESFQMEGVYNSSAIDIQSTENSVILNHYAILRVQGGEYYGAMATLNVWGVTGVGPNQGSAAVIWVSAGLPNSDRYNIIKAGWHVKPALYGDNDTHLFVSWSVDIKLKTGCDNLNCKGFVLYPATKYVPGNILRPLSTYNGPQYYITLKISKDIKTGDWWLHAGHYGDIPIGYWPNSLFTSLQGSASIVDFGGVVGYPENEKSPPMGSGHFPFEGQGKAASLRNIQVISKNGIFYTPKPIGYQDRKDCYQIGGGVTLFGGPGGCT